MTRSETISSECGKYELTALLMYYEDHHKYKYACCYFTFDDEIWDNEEYLYEIFYPYLQSGITKEDFGFSDEDRQELLEMFQLGESLGYFDQVKDDIKEKEEKRLKSVQKDIVLGLSGK